MEKNPHCWGSVLFGFYKKLGFGSVRVLSKHKNSGFGSVRVLQKIGVRFSSSSLQAQKQWVRFCSGSSVETRVQFCSLLYGFGNVRQFQLITQLENCNS